MVKRIKRISKDMDKQKSDFVSIAEQITMATVMIQSYKKDNTLSTGTGFIIEDGSYALTAFHVVENATKVILSKPNGIEVECAGWYKAGEVFQEGSDNPVWTIDIAILRLQSKFTDLTPAIIDPTGADIGEDVGFIGYPNGGIRFQTKDVIYRPIPLITRSIVAGGVYHEYPGGIGEFYLLLDRPSFPGCSGGPVFSSKTGKVKAVISATPYMPKKILVKEAIINAYIPDGYSIAFGLRMMSLALTEIQKSGLS